MNEHQMMILASQRTREMQDEARRARLARSATQHRPQERQHARPRSGLRIRLDHILGRVPA